MPRAIAEKKYDVESLIEELTNSGYDLQEEEVDKLSSAVRLVREKPELLERYAAIDEAQATGAAWAFFLVSFAPMFLILIFGLIVLYDRSQGGYKAVELAPGVTVEDITSKTTAEITVVESLETMVV